MATNQMNDSWTSIRNQIEVIWKDAEFNEKEMKHARGNLAKMVSLIHEKTGESPAEIRQKMAAIL